AAPLVRGVVADNRHVSRPLLYPCGPVPAWREQRTILLLDHSKNAHLICASLRAGQPKNSRPLTSSLILAVMPSGEDLSIVADEECRERRVRAPARARNSPPPGAVLRER